MDLILLKKHLIFRNEFNKLLQEDLSLDECKNKYMDFKQRHDEFVKEFEIAMGDKMLLVNNNTNNKKSVVKNDDYFNSVIKKFNFSEKTKEEQGYNGSPDVKEVENSLYKRYMEDKLSKDEIKILNKFGTDYLTEGVDLSALHKRKIDFLKTLTSMNEFNKIRGAERA